MLLAGCQAVEVTEPGVSASNNPSASYKSTQEPEPAVSHHPENEFEGIFVILQQVGADFPADASVLEVCSGDIGQDGAEDIVVILEYPASERTAQEWGDCLERSIYVLTALDEGTYRLCASSNQLILNSNSGGVFGDPYSGMGIDEAGKLSVGHYGGNAWRRGTTHTFSLEDGTLFLTSSSTFSLDLVSGGESIMEYDYKSGVCVKYGKAFETDETRLKIYEGTFFSNLHAFEEVDPWATVSHQVDPWYPMPSFPQREEAIPEGLTAQEALDQVKNEHFPNMEKVMLPCTDEIIENYVTLLGHDIPNYYYTDGIGYLYYDGPSMTPACYGIRYMGIDTDISEFYDVPE